LRVAPALGGGLGPALEGAGGPTTVTRRGPGPPERDGASRNCSVPGAPYGVATKFQVFDVANVDDGAPLPYWLTFQIRFAVDGSGVAAA
jgi:hypothetical protein